MAQTNNSAWMQNISTTQLDVDNSEGTFLDIDLSDEGAEEKIKTSFEGTDGLSSSSLPPMFQYHKQNASSISSLSSIASHNSYFWDYQNEPSTSDNLPQPNVPVKQDDDSETPDFRKILRSTLSFFSKDRLIPTNSQPSLVNGTSPTNKSMSHSVTVASSSGLILYDRPSGLPSKSPEEIKRHQEEYRRILESARQKEHDRWKQHLRTQSRRLEEEERVHQLSRLWKEYVLPNWNHLKDSQRVRELFWEGIPSSVRGQVWIRSIQNRLQLNEDEFSQFREQLQAKEFAEKQALSHSPYSSLNFSGNEVCECFHSTTLHSNHHPNDPSKCDGNNRETNENKVNALSACPTKSPTAEQLRNDSTDVTLRRKKGDGEEISSCPYCGLPKRVAFNGITPERPISQCILGGYRCSGAIGQLRHIRLDLPRTFPNLSLFHEGGPLHEPLFEVLGSYVCYRPDMGYVQGMSFLAATLLLAMDQAEAFICFANILHAPCLYAFYSLEESAFQCYFDTFDLLLQIHLPRLHRHFHQQHLELKMFLIEWIVTIFSKSLPLECVFRVWDLYAVDGEAALFRTALGILRLFEDELCASGFDQLATFLTNPLPHESPLLKSPNQLMSSVRTIPSFSWPPEGTLQPDTSCGIVRVHPL